VPVGADPLADTGLHTLLSDSASITTTNIRAAAQEDTDEKEEAHHFYPVEFASHLTDLPPAAGLHCDVPCLETQSLGSCVQECLFAPIEDSASTDDVQQTAAASNVPLQTGAASSEDGLQDNAVGVISLVPTSPATLLLLQHASTTISDSDANPSGDLSVVNEIRAAEDDAMDVLLDTKEQEAEDEAKNSFRVEFTLPMVDLDAAGLHCQLPCLEVQSLDSCVQECLSAPTENSTTAIDVQQQAPVSSFQLQTGLTPSEDTLPRNVAVVSTLILLPSPPTVLRTFLTVSDSDADSSGELSSIDEMHTAAVVEETQQEATFLDTKEQEAEEESKNSSRAELIRSYWGSRRLRSVPRAPPAGSQWGVEQDLHSRFNDLRRVHLLQIWPVWWHIWEPEMPSSVWLLSRDGRSRMTCLLVQRTM
jgi:hypothetical protein